MSDRPLSSAFVAAAPAYAGDRDALEEELAALVEGARLAWPNVALPVVEFCELLAARTAGSPSELHASDLWLACACARGTPAALAAFDAEYVAMIPAYVSHLRLPSERVEELQQVVRKQLFVADGGPAKISTYAARGPLGGWLRVLAVRAALKLLRGTPDSASDDELLASAAPLADPELGFAKEADRVVFLRAFGDALTTLSVRDQLLVRQHHIDGLSIDELATLHRSSRSSVARWIVLARNQLLKETKARLVREHRLSDSECASLIRHAHSRFDVTLSSLFGKP